MGYDEGRSAKDFSYDLSEALMKESAFQARVRNDLKAMFPGCIVLKNDASYQQGIPDYLLLWGPFWAALEIKADLGARLQPNQDYWISQMDSMSFAAIIYPENQEEVYRGLQQAFRHR